MRASMLVDPLAADAEDSIWSAAAGQDAALWKFNPRDRLEEAKTRRPSACCIPTWNRVATLGAYYLNGAPGHPFKRQTAASR